MLLRIQQYKNNEPQKLNVKVLNQPQFVIGTAKSELTHINKENIIVSNINIDIDQGTTIKHLYRLNIVNNNDKFNVTNHKLLINELLFTLLVFDNENVTSWTWHIGDRATDRKLSGVELPVSFGIDCGLQQCGSYLFIWYKNLNFILNKSWNEQSHYTTFNTIVECDECPLHYDNSCAIINRETCVMLLNGPILNIESFVWVKIKKKRGNGKRFLKYIQTKDIISHDLMFNLKLFRPYVSTIIDDINYLIANEYDRILTLDISDNDQIITIRQESKNKNNHYKSIFCLYNSSLMCLNNVNCNIINLPLAATQSIDLTVDKRHLKLSKWLISVSDYLKEIHCNYKSYEFDRINQFIQTRCTVGYQSISQYSKEYTGEWESPSDVTSSITNYLSTNQINCKNPKIFNKAPNTIIDWNQLLEIQKIKNSDEFGLFTREELKENVTLCQYFGWEFDPSEYNEIKKTPEYQQNHKPYECFAFFANDWRSNYIFFEPPKKKRKKDSDNNNNEQAEEKKEFERLINIHFPSKLQMFKDDELRDYVVIDPVSLGVNEILDWVFWVYIKDCTEDKEKQNVQFVHGYYRHWPSVFVVTTCNIPKGSQLFGY